jgi:predicted O-methyltransferase YrrM
MLNRTIPLLVVILAIAAAAGVLQASLTTGVGVQAGGTADASAGPFPPIPDADTMQEDENAGSEVEDLDAFLAELEAYGRRNRMMNVPREHGRFLQLMTQLSGAKRVLEIGASNGYSGLWIGRSLRATGGKLITIEFDKRRGGEARENFKRAGFDDIITLHIDDAFKVVPELEGQFDLIFVDAWKEDYLKFFKLTYPMLKDGGVFMAHNAISHAEAMSDFLETVKTHPRLITSVVQMGRDGFAVSYKTKSEKR